MPITPILNFKPLNTSIWKRRTCDLRRFTPELHIFSPLSCTIVYATLYSKKLQPTEIREFLIKKKIHILETWKLPEGFSPQTFILHARRYRIHTRTLIAGCVRQGDGIKEKGRIEFRAWKGSFRFTGEGDRTVSKSTRRSSSSGLFQPNGRCLNAET